MIKNDTDQVGYPPGTRVIGRVFNTPVTVWKTSWVPLTQLIAWLIFTRGAARRKPSRSPIYWSAEGFMKMGVTLGSEWCHNFAHAFAANVVGKPMDQIRIQMGIPRCIYHQLNDTEVKPRQHIIRALGGPLFNLLMVPIMGLLRFLSKPDSILRETAQIGLQTNMLLSTVSFLPIPGIDGGPILKWTLVEKSRTIEQADRAVRNINGPLALLLGLFSSQAFLKKKILLGLFSGMLGLISLCIFAGWLKEEDVSV